MTKLQFGLQLYSVRDHFQDKADQLDCLKQLKAMGYNVVQPAGYGAATAAELRDMLDQAGLTAPAIHIGYARIRDEFDAVVEEMKTLGVTYLGMGMPKESYTAEGVVAFAKEASELGKKLAEHGLRLMYHNHAREFERLESTGKNYMEMLFENSDENLLFELDLFWVQRGGGNPIDYLNRFKGRMVTAHIKDMDGCAENCNVIAAIGKGNLNFKSIIPACDACDIQYVFIEQDNAPELGSIQCVHDSLDYLVAEVGGRF